MRLGCVDFHRIFFGISICILWDLNLKIGWLGPIKENLAFMQIMAPR